MFKLSVITLTFNSERTLSGMLEAVINWADEIIIVDCGSSDKTLEIAAKFKCTVFYRNFDGFGAQKDFAVSKTRNDWVMIVDSDEIVTGELKEEIKNVLEREDFAGYEVQITLIFMDRVMKYGHDHKMLCLRLFNKKYAKLNDALVHERVLTEGKVGKLQGEILHNSYGSLYEYFEKFNKYTTSAAIDLFRKKKKTNSFRIAVRFPIQFFKNYFIDLNFLNGYPGFIWALFSAFYPVVKYAKLKEITEKQ